MLIVERHEDTRALYALALSANGFDVVAVHDGADAYPRAWEIHPDIIVTELAEGLRHALGAHLHA